MKKKARQLRRTTFRTSRLLDFCSRKELIAQTGHRPEIWPLVLLKELVDNALDACEDEGIAPEVHVAVDRKGITVSDNGPGIPPETVEGIRDFSVRVSSREAYVSPTRGAQGNALKTVVAMPFVLDGSTGRVDIASRGVRHEITLEVDRIRQEPKIRHEKRSTKDPKNGTSVRVLWPNSASSILRGSKERFLQIADDYCWLNPHLALRVDWWEKPEGIFAATDRTWKKWQASDPTSPHWYKSEHLERLIAGYISHGERNGTEKTVREFVSEFRGLSGSAKQKRVLDGLGLARVHLTDLLNGNGLDRKRVVALLEAMQAESKAVKPQLLGLIGKEHMRLRCDLAGGEMESFAYKRVFDDEDGIPKVIETAFMWLGEREERRRLVTGVNWSPGIVNPFRELGRYGEGLDSFLREQRASADEPIVMVVHLACPRAEYTDRGKSAVVVDDDGSWSGDEEDTDDC